MRGLKFLHDVDVTAGNASHSLRNAWIEIFNKGHAVGYSLVAFPAECVD